MNQNIQKINRYRDALLKGTRAASRAFQDNQELRYAICATLSERYFTLVKEINLGRIKGERG